MRGRALALGLAVEADLTAAQTEIPPEESEAHCLLLNSLGCRPVSAIDGRPRPHLSAAEAEAFWRRLL